MFFGGTRDRLLDRADPDLMLSPVVVQFGKFMKVVVVVSEHELENVSVVTHCLFFISCSLFLFLSVMCIYIIIYRSLVLIHN